MKKGDLSMKNKNFWEDYVGHTVPEEPKKIILKDYTGKFYEVTEEEYALILKRKEAMRQIILGACEWYKKTKEKRENEGKRE